MFKREGYHLGDCWSYVREGWFHLFYLSCADSIERHTRWTIAHASTTDFCEWKHHADVLDSDPSDEQLSCLSTGSVVRWQDRFWLSFCGNHNSQNPTLSFACSDDLETWELCYNEPIGIDGLIYTKRPSAPFGNPRWRDPFLFVYEKSLYILLCAGVADARPEADGVIGVLRTQDMKRWEYLPPLEIPRLGTDLECPKLFEIEGRWHLILSLFDVTQSPKFRGTLPANLNPNTSYVLTADHWQGPYSLHGDGRLYASDVAGFPYANEVFHWQGEWHAMGTCWSQRKADEICEPHRLQVHPTGLHSG